MTIEVLDPIKGKKSVEIAEYLRAESKKVKEVYEKKIAAGVDGQQTYNLSVAEAETWRSEQERLGVIGKYYEDVYAGEAKGLEVESLMNRLENTPANAMPFAGSTSPNGGLNTKTAGQRFVESKEYKAAEKTCKEMGQWDSNQKFNVALTDFNFKTVMATSQGFTSPNYRTDVVVPIASRRPVIQNYIPEIPFDMDAYKYMEQTVRTNAAAGVAEQATLAQGAIEYVERSVTVEAIGQYIPVTEQQLAVSASIQSLIDNDLMIMQMLKEETDILSGDGNTPNILGFYAKPGVQTQAKGTDPGPDAVYKLLTKLRGGSGSGFVEPGPQFWHPNDWQDIRLLRDSKGDYLWGNPAEAGPETIWGKTIIQTTAATENSPLTGDFQLFSNLVRRLGIQIQIGMTNDDFIKLKQTIRCYSRLALVIKRATAFGFCTGM